jgi:hypothetical protein
VQDKVAEEVILKRLSSEILKFLRQIRVKTEPGVEFSLGGAEAGSPNLQAALAAAWGALKGSKSAIVFLIDEARVLEKNRADLILYLRAVLEQLQINRVPVMFVPAGKLTISGPSGTGFSPLVRTFPPVILENFSPQESRAFIDRKLSQVGLKITDRAFAKVAEVTEGHPFVLTAYMATAYSKYQPPERELSEAHVKAADVEFLGRVLAPFFSRFYDQAGPMSKRILSALASEESGKSSLSELCGILGRRNNELSPHLAKLVQDGAIIRVDRGCYRLFHHLLGEYITAKASPHN